MTTQVKISQEQKDAIKRIRKAQDKALAGKIGDEVIMIDLDCTYHHWSSFAKPSISVTLSIWHNDVMSQLHIDLGEECCKIVGADTELTYDEFYETASKHIGYSI